MSNTGRKIYKLSKPDKILRGEIKLSSSKSESNRALIIQALSKTPVKLNNISDAQDTQTLLHILGKDTLNYREEAEYNVGAAGTAMRFLTAYFATKPGTRILTGNERMKQRPIKPLVEALVQLGANIQYLEKEGYPPLKISGKTLSGKEIEMDGSISSQFTTALMLIAPQLRDGLLIHFKGKVTSRPYINMTLKMLEHFNVSGSWIDKGILISNQQYKTEKNPEYTIEGDWSSASYWYSMAALSEEADIELLGLNKTSFQADFILKDLYTLFGVKTEFIDKGIRLTKTRPLVMASGFDFSHCPDIAQTVIVTSAGLHKPILLNGLHTLKIKETDRILALRKELKKLGIQAEEHFPGSIEIKEYPVVPEKQNSKYVSPAQNIQTYDDHRMAMAFAPLAMTYHSITIENPDVVNKSYPAFWKDLRSVGFKIDEINESVIPVRY
jgi:3-phosphoshikimate 1-carboxyvinyltransferase